MVVLQEFLKELKQQIAIDRFNKKRERLLVRRKRAREILAEIKARQQAREQFTDFENEGVEVYGQEEGGGEQQQQAGGDGDWGGDDGLQQQGGSSSDGQGTEESPTVYNNNSMSGSSEG